MEKQVFIQTPLNVKPLIKMLHKLFDQGLLKFFKAHQGC